MRPTPYSSAVARHARCIASISPASLSATRRRTSASSPLRSGSKSQPFSPSATRACAPPRREQTTGTPWAKASSRTRPKGSSQTEGTTMTSTSSSKSRESTCPRKSTGAPPARSRRLVTKAGSPSPATCATIAPSSSRAASIKCSRPFDGCRRARKPTRKEARGSGSRTRSGARREIALGMTWRTRAPAKSCASRWRWSTKSLSPTTASTCPVSTRRRRVQNAQLPHGCAQRSSRIIVPRAQRR